MKIKILVGALVLALAAVLFMLVGFPFFFRIPLEDPKLDYDQQEEGKVVLDSNLVVEFRDDPGWVKFDPPLGGRETLEDSESRKEEVAWFPWHKGQSLSKVRFELNPNRKEIFEPETKYTVEFENGEKIPFETITLPKVTRTSPCSPGLTSVWGFVGLSTTMCVTLTFNEEVVWEDRYFSITPAAKVKVDAQTYETGEMLVTLMPDPRWENGMNYSLTVKAGLKDKFGHELAEDYNLVFSTKLPPKVVEAMPVGEAVPADSSVRIKFDIRNLDRPTVEESFKIHPQTAGTFEWEDYDVLVWKSAKLDYSTRYAIEVSGKSTEGDSIVLYFWSFKTEDPPVSVEIQSTGHNPTTLRTIPSGGIDSYSYQWSTGETSEQISVDVPAGEVWNVSVVVSSGNRTGSAEISVSGPPLPPPPEPDIGEPAVQPPPTTTIGEGNKIILTFDDSGSYASQILDTLAQFGAKAIFFPTGSWAAGVPDLIQRMKDEGHLVGNHTYSHAYLSQLSPEAIKEEVLGGAVGNTNLLRPPGGYGCWGSELAYIEPIVQELGYEIYCWDIETGDFNRRYPGGDQEILNLVLSQAHAGGVVLLHMHVGNTVVALPAIIKGLQDAGYVVSW